MKLADRMQACLRLAQQQHVPYVVPQQQLHRSQQHLVEGVLSDGQSSQAHLQHTGEDLDMVALLDQIQVAKQHLLGGTGMGMDGMRLADHKCMAQEQLNDPLLSQGRL